MEFFPISLRFLFLVAFCATIVVGDDGAHDNHNHQEEEQRILEKLVKNYNKAIRPVGVNGTGPTVVAVNMYIRNVQKIDQVDGNWKLQLTYRQEWEDSRLAYIDEAHDLKYLTLTDTRSIWTPDIFFPNELKSELHYFMKPNILVRIHPNGHVLFSIRVTLTLLCKDAMAEPKKSETVCSIVQESYSYTKEDISLVWKETDPVQIKPENIQVPNFVFKSVETKSCDVALNTGIYTCTRADFTFRRPECLA